MSQPKVSIIIPVYNTPEPFFRYCLDSVFAQTLKEVEVICVDDCSTDGSLGILEEYEKKHPNMKIIKHATNQGISVARNTGASHVTGEYLYFMDCDDWIEPNAMETLYPVAKEKELDVLVFEGESWYETQELRDKFSRVRIYQLKFSSLDEEVRSGQAMFEEMMEHHKYSSMIWLQLVKTSYYREEGLSFHPLTGCCGEDLAYSFWNFMAAKRMAIHHEVFYHYRIRGGSGSKKKRNSGFVSGYSYVCMLILMKMKEQNIKPEKKINYHIYYHNVIRGIIDTVKETTDYEVNKFYEVLYNMGNILYSNPLKQVFSPSQLKEVFQEETEFCFFGAGERANLVLERFREEGVPYPVAICDNKQALHGSCIEGIPIISLEEAKKLYPNSPILITNLRFHQEIYSQLVKEISDERIIEFCF